MNCKYLKNVSDGQLAIGYCSKHDEPDPYCDNDDINGCSYDDFLINQLDHHHKIHINIYDNVLKKTVDKDIVINKLKGIDKTNHVTVLRDLEKVIDDIRKI